MMSRWTGLDVAALLSDLGIRGERVGAEIRATCPNQSEHTDGRDNHPSWRIIVDDGHPRVGQHFCHPCGFGGGPVKLVMRVSGVSYDDATARIGADPEWAPDPDTKWLGWDADPGIGTPSLIRGSGMAGLPRGCVPVTGPGDLPRWASVYWTTKTGTPARRMARFGVQWGAYGRLTNRLVIPAVTAGTLYGYSARAVDFRGVLREVYGSGGWPSDVCSDTPWDTERGTWTDAIARRLIRRPGPILDAAMAWFECTTRRPGIRYLTPREQVGARGQEPEPGADMGASLMFWDLDPRSEQVTLVEGGLKAVRLAEAGWPRPCGIPGASGLTPARRALLATATVVWYPGDPDSAGTALGHRLVEEIAGRGTDVRVVPMRAPVDRVPVAELAALWATLQER